MSFGVDALDVRFGETSALAGVAFDAPTGEVTAVVGGDGAGKSTLLRVLAGRIRPSSGDVRSVGAAEIGYQPSTSGVWPNLSVAENVAFVGRSYAMPTSVLRERGEELLERAGLTAAQARLGRDLSGGMRQKLGFVLAILHEPRLVLLDEPSTGVDPVSRVELWRLISATAAGDTAVVLATTYLDEAQRAASVTALDRGAVIAAGTPDEIIASMPGRITLLAAGSLPTARSWRRGVERHAWTPEKADAGSSVTPDLEDALIALTLSRQPADPDAEADAPASAHPRRDARLAASASAATASATRDVVAEGRGVVRRFGTHTAVDDVSIDVRAGEIVGLIGANGAGKTTFLRTLIGLDSPDEGEVTLFGDVPDEQSRRRLGYVPQGLGLFRTLSVRENVEFFATVYRTPPADLPPSLAELSRAVVNEIGLGRQRQLAFTLALSHQPELLVLDEPTSGVDPLSRARLWDIIHAQADAGRGVLVTTHYLQEAEQCTRLALMSHGRLLGSGSTADIIGGAQAVLVRSPHWQQAFTALSDAGLPTMLSGRDIRVAGTPAAEVRAALGDLDAHVDEVPPTLEEAMVLLET